MVTDNNDCYVIYSENMVGIDYVKLCSHSALLQLVRLSEEMGLYHIEFDIERPDRSSFRSSQISFDDMKFVKGE